MSYATYSSTRKLLINHTGVTNLVPAGNIRIGFSRELNVFPSISITQVGGGTYGYTGYGTSVDGSKMRREDRTIQVDIYNRDSMLSSQVIGDAVDVALMSGTGFRKLNDNDIFEEGIQSFRKIQTWSFWQNVND